MPERKVTTEEIKALQRVLTDRGLYSGDIDGRFGAKSREAVRVIQETLGHEPTGTPTFELLIELGVITRNPRRPPMNLFGWINKQTLTTALRYILVALGGFVVSRGWIPAEFWDEIMGAVTALILAAWGIYESNRNKVVLDGQQVPVKALPPSTQAELKAEVPAAKAKA